MAYQSSLQVNFELSLIPPDVCCLVVLLFSDIARFFSRDQMTSFHFQNAWSCHFFPLIIFRQQEADVTKIFWWGELKLTLSSEQTIDVNIRDRESDVVAFFLLVKRHKTIPGCNIFGVCENVTNSSTESACTTRLATPGRDVTVKESLMTSEGWTHERGCSFGL